MILRLFHIISLLSIVMGAVLIVLVTAWQLWPYQPIVYKDAVFPISHKTVHAGSMVHYTVNYCKNMDIPAEVTREFINELIFVTPTTISNRPVGCHSIEISVLVPSELPTGHYLMRQHYTYQVNPIRTITITKDTEAFFVMNATESGELR